MAREHLQAITSRIERLTALKTEVEQMIKACAKGRIAKCRVIVVLSHHERHDGGGYPRGLKGDELPIEVSVISVADTYDAMTTDRPYRKGLAWDVVRAEMVRQRGKQWRERAVDSFIEMIDEERRSARVGRQQPTPGPAQPAAQALT